MRTPSSSTPEATPGQSARSGWARATSNWVRAEARGLRSSCEASLTKRRWRSEERCRRSSMRFMVAARRPTSSPVPGSGTRWCRSPAPISATRERMASTGRRARPTTSQVTTATTPTSRGTTMAIVRPKRCTSALTASRDGSTTERPTTPVSTDSPPPSPRPARVRSG